MRVSEEAVEAAAQEMAGQWSRRPNEIRERWRLKAREVLEAALPYLTPNPWVDASSVEGADMRPFVGLDGEGTLFLCYRAYDMWWEGAQPDARPVLPISVMPLYTPPVDTKA